MRSAEYQQLVELLTRQAAGMTRQFAQEYQAITQALRRIEGR